MFRIIGNIFRDRLKKLRKDMKSKLAILNKLSIGGFGRGLRRRGALGGSIVCKMI